MNYQAHQRYQLVNGDYVPGHTTVCGLRDKPFLTAWANKLGLKGIDSSAYVDELAAVGHLTHARIAADLTGIPITPEFMKDYSPEQIRLSDMAYAKYLDWKSKHKIKIVLSEKQLVSEAYRFGGTLDFYGKVDDKIELVEFKATGGIWPIHFVQLSAQRILITENKYPDVEQARVLCLPRSPAENFSETIVELYNLGKFWQQFECLLRLYHLENDTKKWITDALPRTKYINKKGKTK